MEIRLRIEVLKLALWGDANSQSLKVTGGVYMLDLFGTQDNS